ncbi:MAG TPA: SDR family NAD(P)-dependent oxidoreductase [Candidatus Omnitrophota bacterium]|mgnify:CR=1 FL=1|nr:SDR family NAD(P)-dependent oxidoreductase [Candidatus Omnitrophota bacterium]
MERVLVTGGAGFIGSHLVDELITKGHKVTVLDIFEPQVHLGKRPKYLNKKAEYIKGDVRKVSDLKRALGGVDVVFHLAAQVGVGQSMYEIGRYIDHNTHGTAILMDHIIHNRGKVRKVVVASSMSIYGEGSYNCVKCGYAEPVSRTDGALKKRNWEYACRGCGSILKPVGTSEEKTLRATSIYAISKKDQEEIVLTVGKAYKLPSVALRFFNVYGPRQSLSNPYTGVCAIFSSRIKNGNPPLVYEDGNQSRDFVNVRDIVSALTLVMDTPKADYGYFNVGTGKATSILQVADTLSRLYGAEPKVIVKNQFRAGDIRHCFADISKIRAIGFRPSVNFKDGMRELVEWGKCEDAVDMVKKADLQLSQLKLKI